MQRTLKKEEEKRTAYMILGSKPHQYYKLIIYAHTKRRFYGITLSFPYQIYTYKSCGSSLIGPLVLCSLVVFSTCLEMFPKSPSGSAPEE